MTDPRVDFIDYGPAAERREPAGTHAFIQWKGTDVCMDFHCDCGEEGGGHFDGYFAYHVKCPACGQEWEMPAFVYPRKVGSQSYPRDAQLLEAYDD